MNALILEDEQAAVHNLTYYLNLIEPSIVISKIIDSVSDAITHLQETNYYDLIFMDIHLADGNAFEILEEVEITAPIIFITAFDEYAVQAFKLKNIDYILKPIRQIELEKAIRRLGSLQNFTPFSAQQIEQLKQLMRAHTIKYRQSFLIQKADIIIPVAVKDIAFFFIENGQVKGTTQENQTYPIEGKLEEVAKELNPKDFFRVNRQYIVHRTVIQHLSIYFNGRLIVYIQPPAKEKIIVSRANAKKLKDWLNHG